MSNSLCHHERNHGREALTPLSLRALDACHSVAQRAKGGGNLSINSSRLRSNNNGFAPGILLITAGIVVIIGAGLFLVKTKPSGQKMVPPLPPVACTADAKLCPDGSSVGRTDPKCEFAPCTSPNADISVNWAIYSNAQYEFTVKYPDTYKQAVVENSKGLFMTRFSGQKESDYYSVTISENSHNPKLSNPISNPECYPKLGGTLQTPWTLSRSVCNMAGEALAAYVVKPKYVYVITTSYGENATSRQESMSRLSQFLSTFKFIDQTQEARKRCGYLGLPGVDTSCPKSFVCQGNPGNDAGGICVKQ